MELINKNSLQCGACGSPFEIGHLERGYLKCKACGKSEIHAHNISQDAQGNVNISGAPAPAEPANPFFSVRTEGGGPSVPAVPPVSPVSPVQPAAPEKKRDIRRVDLHISIREIEKDTIIREISFSVDDVVLSRIKEIAPNADPTDGMEAAVKKMTNEATEKLNTSK